MANEQLSLDLPEPKKKRGRPKKKPNYGRGQISQGPAKSGDMKIREKGTSKVKAARRGRFVVSGRDALKYVPKGKIDKFNAANQMKFTGPGFSSDPKAVKKFAEKKNFTKAQTNKVVKAATSLNNLRQQASTLTGIPKTKIGGKTLNSLFSKANKKIPLKNVRKLFSISLPMLLLETKKAGEKKLSIMEQIDRDQKTKKITPPKKVTPEKVTPPKKETAPKRKIDHSSDYSRARMGMKTLSAKDKLAMSKKPSYFQNIDAKSKPKKQEKNNVVKTRSGGKVRTRSGFLRTGR
tara:strand:+ start:223 stop:1098 length:876 start_codon:yes stop_codon:yes gene_type:complete